MLISRKKPLSFLDHFLRLKFKCVYFVFWKCIDIFFLFFFSPQLVLMGIIFGRLRVNLAVKWEKIWGDRKFDCLVIIKEIGFKIRLIGNINLWSGHFKPSYWNCLKNSYILHFLSSLNFSWCINLKIKSIIILQFNIYWLLINQKLNHINLTFNFLVQKTVLSCYR